MFHRALGNCCETATKTQQHILKSGDQMTLYLRAPGNWCGVMTFKSEGQGWYSTICRSPTIDTLKKSSRTCGKSWISQKRHQYSTWRPMYWSGQRWKPLCILDQITQTFLKYNSKNLFHITQKLILDHQAEILNVSPIDWTAPSWTRSALTRDQVITWTKAKVHVCSDSVLCLGTMQEHSAANQRWKNQLEKFLQSNSYRIIWNWWRTDWVPVESFSQDILHLTSSRRSKKTWKIATLTLNFLKIGSSSCQSSMASIGRGEEILNIAFQNPKKSRSMRRDSRKGTGHS